MAEQTRELVFVYASRDQRLCERLDVHLAGLKNEGLLTTWDTRAILPGAEMRGEMARHLERAGVILLLLSADFLAEDDCYGVALPLALKRAEAGEALVLPVLLSPVEWQETPLAPLRCLPENGRPVTAWTNREAALSSVAASVRMSLYANAHDARAVRAAEARTGKTEEVSPMISTPAELTTSTLHKAIGRYYSELNDYRSKGSTELILRPAFQNLLAEMARRVNLTLVHEMTIRGRIRPDGVLLNSFHIRRGFWEAKGPHGNLEAEIEQKKRDGYPLDNALFENTVKAVLFQSGLRYDFDLNNRDEVTALLQQFLTYQKPETANFEHAVLDFKDQIPTIAKRLLALIDEEHQRNSKFITAFTAFHELCARTLNPKISPDEIKEMLIQHLLTERLFRKVFDNPDFITKNAIASEIEKVIQALTSRSFKRSDFLRSLDPFYGAIELEARSTETWSERQSFLNSVYERFFQGFAIKKADTLGIVYTPQEIVDFMVASVDEVLKREFGKSQGLATPGVKILDPCVGTGNFIVNIIKYIATQSRSALKEKYARDLFCNEIALLPYYIASMNIEHEYYTAMGEYAEFEGICFVDSLELAESQQMSLFVEENTARIEREKEADIMVVVGNPPYNVGQKNENDTNKNQKYSVIDKRIKESYAKDSKATLVNKVYDLYVRFFRWASDRISKPGIVCFVSNNSFVDQIAFDGMRKHLLKDFDAIYHLDFHGNVRKNPKLSGTTHNIFGIQVGVGITIAVRTAQTVKKSLYYYRVPEQWTKIEKLDYLAKNKSISAIEWNEVEPDLEYNWLTEGMASEFKTFLSLGNKETKGSDAETLFRMYSLGVATNRDEWVYAFNKPSLSERMKTFIQRYNGEVFRFNQERADPEFPKSKEMQISFADKFVNSNISFLKWTDRLKDALIKGQELKFDNQQIRRALYRPFCRKYIYFDQLLNQRRYQQHLFFPILSDQAENIIICSTGIGADCQTFLAANTLVDLKCGISGNSGIQCFPYYTYAADGTNRRENITDWALGQFREKYGEEVSKWDIFHYVYAMLHHPQYRERYAENLKRDLPHIPLVWRREAFEAAARIGGELMALHVGYERQEAYPLTALEDSSVPYGQLMYVEKMKLTPDRSAVVVNRGLTLAGIPEACFRYRLGNRSALEWIIDQYQVSKDARSGIVSDPNNPHDPEYIVRLLKQVVTVSVKTVELVDELARLVTQEDWLDTLL